MKFPEIKDILQSAREIFQKTTGLSICVRLNPSYDNNSGDNNSGDNNSPVAQVRIAFQDMKWYFHAEVRKKLSRAVIGLTAQQFNKFTQKGILISRHVTPVFADMLKEMDIPFLDTAGNAFKNLSLAFCTEITCDGSRLFRNIW